MAASNTQASPPNYNEYAATSTTAQTTGPSLNLAYVKSIPGIIKIAEIVSESRVCILQLQQLYQMPIWPWLEKIQFSVIKVISLFPLVKVVQQIWFCLLILQMIFL